MDPNGFINSFARGQEIRRLQDDGYVAPAWIGSKNPYRYGGQY